MKSCLHFLLLCCLGINWAYAEWPEITHPLDTQVTSAGNNMKLNGIPMQVFQLKFAHNVNAVVRHYTNELHKLNPAIPVGSQLLADGGGMLNQATQGYLITLNIAPQTFNSSTATLSISEVGQVKNITTTPYEVRLPFGSNVASDMETTDEGKRARHLVFHNAYSPQTNRQELVGRLSKAGYQLDNLLTTRSAHGEVLYFVGNGKEARLRLVRTKNNGTQGDLILVNKE